MNERGLTRRSIQRRYASCLSSGFHPAVEELDVRQTSTRPMSIPSDPAAIVQRQLDAYNRRDVDALLSIYAEDAELFEHPTTLLASGSAALRDRFIARFQEPNLHAQLLAGL